MFTGKAVEFGYIISGGGSVPIIMKRSFYKLNVNM